MLVSLRSGDKPANRSAVWHVAAVAFSGRWIRGPHSGSLQRDALPGPFSTSVYFYSYPQRGAADSQNTRISKIYTYLPGDVVYFQSTESELPDLMMRICLCLCLMIAFRMLPLLKYQYIHYATNVSPQYKSPVRDGEYRFSRVVYTVQITQCRILLYTIITQFTK